MNGKIQSVIEQKGFGFILGEDGKSYFFHRSALMNTTFEELFKNVEVRFEATTGPKGNRAEAVEVI